MLVIQREKFLLARVGTINFHLTLLQNCYLAHHKSALHHTNKCMSTNTSMNTNTSMLSAGYAEPLLQKKAERETCCGFTKLTLDKFPPGIRYGSWLLP